MTLIANLVVAIAFCHVSILVLEMFLWDKPACAFWPEPGSRHRLEGSRQPRAV